MERYVLFQMYSLIDNQAAAKTESIRHNLSKIMKIAEKDPEAVARLAQSSLVALDFIETNVSPESLYFACLVKKVNGETRDDISEEGLKKTVDLIAKRGFIYKILESAFSSAKKNFQTK
jgi:hypothetical protein